MTALSKWELGEGIANELVASAIEPEKCRETVARFHYVRALALCSDGKHEESRLAIRAASDAFTEIGLEIVDDERLTAALWGGKLKPHHPPHMTGGRP